MTKRDAQTVLALLQHLSGAHTFDEADLLTSVLDLHASAATALSEGALPLDEDALLDTLSEVAQRFADGCFWDEPTEARRPLQTIEVGEYL